MTPAERIAAAITRLEQLKAEAGYVEINGWLAEPIPGDTRRVTFIDRDELAPITNCPLLVTLHRTIDAQLDLLNSANDMKGVFRLLAGEWAASRFGHGVLALADAILGES